MRTFNKVLNGKGLLAASIAMLSGHALAETAGRVSFVSGDATVTGSDGISRALQRGASINGGDRINTRAGRVQVRFTDGSFVSLQPNTVFGVDEYLYANRKPEETSLFFSLVQGGMRTITGAIGKVNKKSYQVRTPVATIGIRGTEYRAVVDSRGLVVSVGRGFVNVSNERGDVTAGARQNIRVTGQDEGPALTDEQAELLATRTGGEESGGNEEEESGNNGASGGGGSDVPGTTPGTVTVSDVQNSNGDYLFLFTSNSLPDSVFPAGPVYQVLNTSSGFSAGRTTGAPSGGSTFYANFDQTGAVTGTPGGLQKLSYGVGVDASDGYAYPIFDSGSLKVVNAGTIGAISWGEFTNGTAELNDFFSAPSTLTANEFLPYVIGREPVGNLGKGTAVYTLQGGTPARDPYSGRAGTLERFNLKVNLDFATVEADFRVRLPGVSSIDLPPLPANTFSASTNGAVSIADLGTTSAFSVNGMQVTDTAGICSSGSCSAGFDAFFAGDASKQVGASYWISADSFEPVSIEGVAALGLSGYNSSTTFASGPGYSLAYAAPGSIDTGVAGGFDTSSLAVTFDSAGLMSTANAYEPAIESYSIPVMDRQAALATDNGQAGALKWGRWYTNTTGSTLVTVNGGEATLGSNQSLHYIVGPMTQPGIFAGITSAYGNGATATYSYQGGTKATGSDGRVGSVTSGSKLTMTFGGLPTLAMDIGIDMQSGNDYRIGGTAQLSLDSTGSRFIGNGNSGTTCSDSSGSTGTCSASVSGFFAGQQAQQIGLGYNINDGISTVSGAAGFGRGSIKRGTQTTAP